MQYKIGDKVWWLGSREWDREKPYYNREFWKKGAVLTVGDGGDGPYRGNEIWLIADPKDVLDVVEGRSYNRFDRAGGGTSCWAPIDKIVPLKAGNKKPMNKFILKYDRNSSEIIETFEALPAARERIVNISDDQRVGRDSICLYEIKKEYKVKITKNVSLR